MAIVTFESKLRQGFRLLCVDKNAVANLTASFSVGNYNRPTQPSNEFVVYPNILGIRRVKVTVDLEVDSSVSRAEERYKTYGGGNNVITSQGVNNNNNWKVTSSLVCKFPTYIEIDVEKLNLPEGTDCIVQFDEGFVVEDKGRRLPSGGYEYPQITQGAPSPANSNFFTFRTPWYGVGFLKSNFTKNIIPLRIKQLGASFPQAFGSVTFKIRYNPGRFASLFVDDFALNSAPVKTTENVLTLYSFTGEGSQQWNGFIPIKITPVPIDPMNSQSSLTNDFMIVQVVDSATEIVSTLTSDAFKYKGTLNNALSVTTTINCFATKTARARSQANAVVSTLSTIIGKIRQYGSVVSMSTNLTNNINHIQRTPRWQQSSSYSVLTGTYTIPISENDYLIAYTSAGGTQLERYTNQSLTRDGAGVQAAERRSIDIGAGGFWVVSNNNNAVDWGAWGTLQNPPIYAQVPAVAVCKSSGDKFAIYRNDEARIKIYNTSGSQMTIYDSGATLNVTAPRHFQIQTVSGNNIFVVMTSSGGMRFMRYNSGTWTTNTLNITDAREVFLSQDNLMCVTSSMDYDKVYVFTRASTTAGFALQQTINYTEEYTNINFDRNKKFIFIGNRSYLWNGSSFVYVRDVNYPNGAGAFTFGTDTKATQIIGTSAKEYIWQ